MATYFVTFGQQYTGNGSHPTFPAAHRDGWVEVLADNHDDARLVIVDWLGQKWSNLYDEGSHDPTYFPLGCLARVWRLPHGVLFIDEIPTPRSV